MNAKTNRMTRLALLAGAARAALVLGGCGGAPDQAVHGELFPPDEAVRPVDRVVDVQSSAAARSDATLNAYHFDRGAALNSLGKTKLDLMLRDDDDSLPLVIYLDVRGDAANAPGAADARRNAVRHYLADRGVVEAQVDLREGPNLGQTRPARDGLRGLDKMEGVAEANQADADAKPMAGLPALGGEPQKK